jgi:branched-chain amino acid transport system permease protein
VTTVTAATPRSAFAAPGGLVWARATRVGLVGGIAAVYLSATGIVEKFNEQPIITDVINLGRAMLLITILLTGYLATRMKVEGRPVEAPGDSRLAAGALAGAMAGAMLGGFVLLFSAIDVRRIFINITPNLLEDLLTFGLGAAGGAALLVAISIGAAALGAGLTFLRQQDRRILLAGLTTVLVVGVLEQMLRVMLDTLQVEFEWLYIGGGLTISGAIIIFAVTVIGGSLWTRRQRLVAGLMRTEGDEAESTERARRLDLISVGIGAAALVLAFTLAVMGIFDIQVGFTLMGIALLVAVLALGLGAARSATEAATGQRRGRGRIGYVAAAAALFALLPLIAGPFLSNVLTTVMVYVLLGLGLNIVVGLAGLLDLGYVAFFAIGAYGMGLATSPISGLVTEGVGEFGAGSQVQVEPLTTFWIALPAVVILAVFAGLVLGAPVVRLRGDYLAIVTLGFGEIIRVIVQSDWAAPLLGGSQGIKLVPAPPPEFLNLREPQKLYYLILIASLLMAYVTWRLQYSRVGRAWQAMREDESVAEGMGISVIRYKLLAFAIGAGVASLGGIFFVGQLSVATPESFQLLVSIAALSVIILGGMGSIPGVIVGAAVLIGLPELLRGFGEYRLLFYGGALVAIMILRPEGLVPNVRRRRELHERETLEAQFAARVGEGPEPAASAAPSEAAITSPEKERFE